jgi:hypothetical protein
MKGFMEVDRIKGSLEPRPVDRAEILIKKVCEKCNNGWMSQLEGRAIPVITRLVDHAACFVDIHDCKTIALWSLKTSMVLEAVNDPEHWLYSDLDRCLLMKKDQIPPFTNIWIAKCINFSTLYSTSRTLSNPHDQARASVSTLAFGCLAIQVRKLLPSSPLNPNTVVTVEERPGPWEQVVSQVWPPSPELVHWPASMGLDGEHGLETLAERFSPTEETTSLCSGFPD